MNSFYDSNNSIVCFMRYSALTITLLIITFQLSFSHTTAQEILKRKVSLSTNNETLKNVIKQINQQTQVDFVYSSKSNLGKVYVTVKVQDSELGNVLSKILPQNITYEVVGEKIVIKNKVSGQETANLILQQANSVNEPAIALQSIIRGEVTGSKGEALTGVNVTAKGSTNGTTTDATGKYTINNVPANGTLIFTYLGYTLKEVPVNNQAVINVVLELETTSLDEVVVIGYGATTKKDITGSIGSVSEKEIADQPMARIEQALAGKVAGLDIRSTGGRPGEGSSIQLRGRRSLVASNDPLLILDGMPFSGSLSDINPYDIASVDVLKDASSTAIYGSRGANGVIIVTSKRGIVSRPRFTIDSYTGPQIRYGRLPYADGPAYAEWAREAYRTQGGYPFTGTNPAQDAIIFDAIEIKTVQSGGKGLDLQDLLLQNGKTEKHQMTVSGGSESIKYNLTGNYLKQEGIMAGDIFNRISLSPKLDVTISPKVTAGTSIQLNYTVNKNISSPSALTQYAFNGNPLGQVYEADGITPRFALTTDGFEVNPMADYWWDSHRADQKGWGASVNAYAQVKIIPGLSYRLQLGTNFRLGTNKVSDGYYSIARNLGLPTASVNNSVNNFKSYQSILSYDKTFNIKHRLTVTAINEFQNSRGETSGAGVSDLPYEAARYNNLASANTVSSVSSTLQETALLSYAGRIFYGFKDRYMLTLSMRADGASQLADGHKWGYFPSAAFAYRISEESFMKGTKSWLSDLKLRLSYGVTGNQAIAPYQTQGALTRTTYSFNEAAGFGYRQNTQANKDLKWESSEVYNVGVDFGFLKGKISGNVEWYTTHTYDLLMFRKLPITSGYDQVLQNVGSTKNKGLEIGLKTVNMVKPNFKWNSGFSFYRNRTKIATLYNGTADDVGNGWFIGHDISVYYNFNKIGIWQTSEAAQAASYGRTVGQIKVQDVDKDGKINANDNMILGDHQPDFVGNMANNFTYKSWDFSFNMNIRWGGMTSVGAFAPYAKKRYNKFIFDYWTPANPTNDYPRPNQLYEGSGLDGGLLTYRDQSQITMPTVTLGYAIPKSWLSKAHISNARVYFSGDNLWYWTKSELRKFNMKPDFSGDNTGTYPATRTFVMGVNVSF